MSEQDTCGRAKRDGSGEPCTRPAGWGTDHPGEGACKLHGGNAGAPEGNQNRTTHGLNADPKKYFEGLPDDQQEYIRDVASAIEDRLRANQGSLDMLDRAIALRIAIEVHIVSKATDYVENSSGLTQTVTTEGGSHERKAALLSDIRKRDKAIFEMLTDIGVLDDPESQKADALESWRSFIEEG